MRNLGSDCGAVGDCILAVDALPAVKYLVVTNI